MLQKVIVFSRYEIIVLTVINVICTPFWKYSNTLAEVPITLENSITVNFKQLLQLVSYN